MLSVILLHSYHVDICPCAHFSDKFHHKLPPLLNLNTEVLAGSSIFINSISIFLSLYIVCIVRAGKLEGQSFVLLILGSSKKSQLSMNLFRDY